MIVTFTGIREIDPAMVEEVEAAVLDIVAQGPTELRFGGALGADTMALEAVCDVEGIRRVVYVPFTVERQPAEARPAIHACADAVKELALPTGSGAYLARNRAMLEGADLVVAFTDGRKDGGTAYTVRAAVRANIPVQIVRVTATRKNPRIGGIDATAKIWALEEYDRALPLTQLVRSNKLGTATAADQEQLARKLAAFIRKTPALAKADTICPMPRRIPNTLSDMAPVAMYVAHMLRIRRAHMERIARPRGGELLSGRVRFPAKEHERTFRYEGPPGQTVILLDNVLTSAGTMEGAIRAVRAAGSTPLGLAVLYGASLGASPV